MSLLDRLLSPDAPPRTLVVVSHPDDETIGAGILLSRLPDAWVLHLTDGAERTRRQELTAAMALAGIALQRLLRIEGVADQEAVHHLPRIAREIAVLLRQLRPEVVITHAYEGGHPDHDAAAFTVRAAVELLRRGRSPLPDIVEMPFDLPPTDAAEVLELSPAERDLKERMLDCFVSQREILTHVRPPVREIFRPAARCDFSRPPTEGRLQYEIRELPVDGARWRDLARDAVEELEMPGWRG